MESKHLDLLFISNSPFIAKVAEKIGIDYFFIDLEKRGKAKRQGGMDTVMSNHSFDDILAVRPFLKRTKLLVRINPYYHGTKKEIDLAIKNGADALMLPMFETVDEVDKFIKHVNKRAEVFLLLETKKGFENIENILRIDGIDRIHVGLNDLHLQLKKKFMFELITDGEVDIIVNSIKKNRPNIKFGIGGVARIGEGQLPASNILSYHYEVGSSSVILSRHFCDLRKHNDKEAKAILTEGVLELRKFYDSLSTKSKSYFSNNREEIKKAIESILGN